MSFDPFESKHAVAILKKVCKGKSLTGFQKVLKSAVEAQMTAPNYHRGGVSIKLAEECLAIGEVIAVGRGNGGRSQPPEAAQAWLEKIPEINNELAALAKQAIDKVRTNSDSASIAEEMGGWPAWKNYCRGLSTRLDKPTKARRPSKTETHVERAAKILRDKLCIFEKEDGEVVELRAFEKGQLTDDDLQSICQLKKLRFLMLTKQKVTDQGLAALSSLKHLRNLVINQCEVTGRGFRNLKLPQLRDLTFGRLGANVVAANCRHLTRLREIRFDDSDLTDRGLASIDFAPSLASIWVSNCDKLKGSGFQKLSGLKKLREVRAARVAFSPAGLKALANLASLRELNLYASKLPASQVSALSTLNRLESLSLQDVGLNDKQLEFLAELRKLKRLELRGNKALTDKTVEVISQLPALEEVSLDRTGITAASIELLSGMKRLNEATASFTNLSRTDEKRLQRELRRAR